MLLIHAAAVGIILDVSGVQFCPVHSGVGIANTACDWHRGAIRIRRRHTRVQALIERPVEVVAVISRATALGLRDEYEINYGVRTRKLASGEPSPSAQYNYMYTTRAYIELQRQEELVERVLHCVSSIVGLTGDLVAHVVRESRLDRLWQLQMSSEARVGARTLDARAFDEYKK